MSRGKCSLLNGKPKSTDLRRNIYSLLENSLFSRVQRGDASSRRSVSHRRLLHTALQLRRCSEVEVVVLRARGALSLPCRHSKTPNAVAIVRCTTKNENTLGFPQREESGIIRGRYRCTMVLAPFRSLNILFRRRGPSQAPLTTPSHSAPPRAPPSLSIDRAYAYV